MAKGSDKTGDLHCFQYGCKFRPFHGADVRSIEGIGIGVQIVPATETPTGYHYIIRTTGPVPNDIRDHFDLELV